MFLILLTNRLLFLSLMMIRSGAGVGVGALPGATFPPGAGVGATHGVNCGFCGLRLFFPFPFPLPFAASFAAPGAFIPSRFAVASLRASGFA